MDKRYSIGSFFIFLVAGLMIFILFIAGKINSNSYLPFGPYMIFGVTVFLLFGDAIIKWYIDFLS